MSAFDTMYSSLHVSFLLLVEMKDGNYLPSLRHTFRPLSPKEAAEWVAAKLPFRVNFGNEIISDL